MFYYYIVFICASICCQSVNARKLPSYITPCKRSNPKLNECIKHQVELIRPRLLKGIPELGLPSYDPLKIPQVILDQGTGPVSFKATFKDLVAYGAKDAVLNSVDINLEKLKISLKLHFPKLRLRGNYDIKGRVLVLPVNGNGISDGNFTDISATVVLHGKYLQKNNKKHITLVDKKVDLKIGGLNMFFDNLFNGNRELIVSTNRFVNENWRDIIKELKPLLEETIATLALQFVKNVFELYSFDELLPP